MRNQTEPVKHHREAFQADNGNLLKKTAVRNVGRPLLTTVIVFDNPDTVELSDHYFDYKIDSLGAIVDNTLLNVVQFLTTCLPSGPSTLILANLRDYDERLVHEKEHDNLMLTLRHDWTFEEVQTLYQQPFMDLLLQAQLCHRQFFAANTIQVCGLYNIKVGGCPEDCAWCGQSIYNQTGVENEPLASIEDIVDEAKKAKARGATRLCLAASWRNPTERNLSHVLEMVKTIKSFDLEACITIGKLKPHQAQALKEAGLDYYNHNLESSREHFAKVSTTRSYQDRLDTLEMVRQAGIKVCSGGILGMGETQTDRLNLLLTLANQPTHPQSVPINQLVAIEGTPLKDQAPVEELEFIRIVACARIMMPKSYVRLSGGRVAMSDTMQALCFMAGANSIHHSEKLLVTDNVDMVKDYELLNLLGIKAESTNMHAKTIPCQVVS